MMSQAFTLWIMCKFYLICLLSSLINGLSGVTKNHNTAAITAGIINNWNVIVQPSDDTNAPAKMD